MIRSLFYILPLSLTLIVSPVFAAKKQSDYEARLTKVAQEMKRIQANINKRQKHKNQLVSRLQKTDKKLATISKDAHKLRKSIQHSNAEIKRFKELAKRTDYASELDQKKLAQLARSQYRASQTAQWRLFLEPSESMTNAQRYLTYHRFISEQRVRELDEASEKIADYTQAAEKAKKQQTLLSQQQAKLQDKLLQLESSKKERRQALKEIKSKQLTSSKKLSSLKQEQAEVQKLLEELQKLMQGVPEPDDPIHKHKGKLAYPVKGNIVRHFNQKRDTGVTKWQGVIIGSPIGKPIKAVYSGQVVFTGWVAGYGNLVILDHGGGYMTVYGNTQSVLSEQGDWVETGDNIALTGESGGQNVTGVYFEVRRKSLPQNPAKWINRKVKS